MDSNTAGFEGWKEVQFFEGKDETGNMTGRQGYRNIVNGEACIPEAGWNGEPPYATGDLASCRHNTDLYRRNYDQIRWD